MDDIKQKELPFKINVVVSQKMGYPCIELRRNTRDINIIKTIISAAYHKRPIVMYPEFTDTMRTIASLIEKGIIYHDQESGNYRFLI